MSNNVMALKKIFIVAENATDNHRKHGEFNPPRTFLLLNGANLEAGQDEKFLTFQRLAAGSLIEEELAEWIRKRT